MTKRRFASAGLTALLLVSLHAQTPDTKEILARVAEATAIILAGEGAGRLSLRMPSATPSPASRGVVNARDGQPEGV